jgi:hypothetical protein
MNPDRHIEFFSQLPKRFHARVGWGQAQVLRFQLDRGR